MKRTYQREKETVTQFIPRMMRMLMLVEPNKHKDELVECIRDRLRGVYQDKLSLYTIDTIEQLNDCCLRIEACLKAARNASKREERESERRVSANKEESGKSSGKGRTDNKPSDKDGSGDSKAATMKCYRCERRGHLARNCRAKSKADGSECDPPRKEAKKEKSVNVVQEEEKPKEGAEGDKEQVKTIRPAGSRHLCMVYPSNLIIREGSLITKNIRCNGVALDSIIDTGAFISVVNAKMALKHNWAIKKKETTQVHAGGGDLNCLGKTMVDVTMQIGAEV